jgi:hypothetical protein
MLRLLKDDASLSELMVEFEQSFPEDREYTVLYPSGEISKCQSLEMARIFASAGKGIIL